MPNAPKTPSRNIRITNELWLSAQAKAAKEGKSISEIVRSALEKYVKH